MKSVGTFENNQVVKWTRLYLDMRNEGNRGVENDPHLFDLGSWVNGGATD